jgi:pimeloyl-ACP methyl ester carboxylesterase
MRERIARFGDRQGLVGILTEPADRGPADRPALVIVNAGIVHRVGPNRLHVRLARRLAESGFAVLRFDLSGLGDSAPRADGLVYHQSRLEETSAAMDYLQQKQGTDRFVVLGLCSGADHAFRMAMQDERVVAAAMIDGYAYATPSFTRAHRRKRVGQAARRLLAPETWGRLVTGKHPLWRLLTDRLAKQSGTRDRRGDVEKFVIDLPPRDVALARTRELTARGVRLLFLYTARLSRMYQAAAHSAQAFPPLDPAGTLQVACLTGTDHTLTLLSHQERLFATVQRWAEQQWPASVEQTAT